jgi:hypothetical protein
MRTKKNEIDKKIKINLTLNELLDVMLTKHINEIKTNKSKFIESLLRDYLNKQK